MCVCVCVRVRARARARTHTHTHTQVGNGKTTLEASGLQEKMLEFLRGATAPLPPA